MEGSPWFTSPDAGYPPPNNRYGQQNTMSGQPPSVFVPGPSSSSYDGSMSMTSTDNDSYEENYENEPPLLEGTG